MANLPVSDESSRQDRLYQEACLSYGAALGRLARAYERRPEEQSDLIQEIHLALWRSLKGFDGRCSLRTWVYRVAHNAAVSYTIRQRSNSPTFIGLEEIEALADTAQGEAAQEQNINLERLLILIQTLSPPDRQLMVLYLEGMDAASIGEITGISAGNVATKIHRIKKILTRDFHQGGKHAN